MSTPRFTAESSIYRVTRAYSRGTMSIIQRGDRLVPQQNSDLESTCGACVCDPGKCCYQSSGACACYSCASEVLPPTRRFLY